MLFFAVSIKPLHWVASIVLPCGVDAAALKPFLCASNDCFIWGSTCGAFFAISVKHASYLVMYSSHSGTPVLGLDESAVVVVPELAGAVVAVVLLVVVVDDEFVALVVFVVEFVAVPPQPNERAAKQRAATINRIFLIFITC